MPRIKAPKSGEYITADFLQALARAVAPMVVTNTRGRRIHDAGSVPNEITIRTVQVGTDFNPVFPPDGNEANEEQALYTAGVCQDVFVIKHEYDDNLDSEKNLSYSSRVVENEGFDEIREYRVIDPCCNYYKTGDRLTIFFSPNARQWQVLNGPPCTEAFVIKRFDLNGFNEKEDEYPTYSEWLEEPRSGWLGVRVHSFGRPQSTYYGEDGGSSNFPYSNLTEFSEQEIEDFEISDHIFKEDDFEDSELVKIENIYRDYIPENAVVLATRGRDGYYTQYQNRQPKVILVTGTIVSIGNTVDPNNVQGEVTLDVEHLSEYPLAFKEANGDVTNSRIVLKNDMRLYVETGQKATGLLVLEFPGGAIAYEKGLPASSWDNIHATYQIRNNVLIATEAFECQDIYEG